MQEFATQGECRTHERQRSCEIREYVKPDGLDPEQKNLLKKRSDQNKSEQDQWYDIFRVLFPGNPEPLSPYIDDDLSEDLNNFFEFHTTRGSSIVADRLHGFISDVTGSSANRESLERVVREAQRELWDQWLQLSHPEKKDAKRESLGPPSIRIREATEDPEPRDSLAATAVRHGPLSEGEDDHSFRFVPQTPQSIPDASVLYPIFV
jgi:hypothetical protein